MGKKFRIGVILILFTGKIYSQHTNLDPNQSYVNVDVPRSPESAGFEKYGLNSISEFTGTPNISIPIYDLKSDFLDVPITLTYQASGIKVSQEASWVGLGWDLIAGGRITVETKGCNDNTLLYSTTNLSSGMQKIFNRLGNVGELSILTFASICEGDPGCPSTPADDLQTVQSMTEFGAGEPDIFRANFMGNSLKFYFDKITGNLSWLGEQSLFTITPAKDANGNITAWTVIDNNGVTYYFEQAETTYSTLPANAIVPWTTTTAWLLTKIIHPNGDYINFSYSNFGYSCPAFNMSASINYVVGIGPVTFSDDQHQNVILQSPFYLTKIENQNIAVDFIMENRNDIYGPGSKRLSKITVSDKLTNTVIKTATFNYSYFMSESNSCKTYLNSLAYYLPSPLRSDSFLSYSNKRLRLDSVSINLANYQPPYRFYYNLMTPPDKYSLSQDHWGYYNGASNSSNGCQFFHLIPNSGLGTTPNLIPPLGNTYGYRECSSGTLSVMMLDKIVYPTGGSSSFSYEPHQSTMAPTIPVTGGGLRVKSITNYTEQGIANITEYSYPTGRYLGTIQYHTRSATLHSCSNDPGWITQEKQSSYGAVNDDDVLVGYPSVTVTEKTAAGQTNGYMIKLFNIATSSSTYANDAVGFDVKRAHWPLNQLQNTTGNPNLDPPIDFLYATMSGFAPTPTSYLEGKLEQIQYFDNNNTLLKTVKYYYHIANYTNNFYDIKAIQNRIGGFDLQCPSSYPNDFSADGIRPVIIFVSPAKSFHTLTDSIVEQTYSAGNFIKKKKAFTYNSYYQPMFESEYNSDNTQTITYTQTSASLTPLYPLPTIGDNTAAIMNMKTWHIYDVPVEKTVIHRNVLGDSSVISSQLNIYRGILPQKVYIMESSQPLALRTQFIPAYFNYPNYPNTPNSGSNNSLQMDGHYKLYTSVDYSPNSHVGTLYTLQGNKAYIWDYFYNSILAQCTNADSINIAFTSFETPATGHWTYPDAGIATSTTSPPTGSKAFTLSSGVNITKSVLSASTTYIVSYWSNTGSSFSVSGSSGVKQGRSFNGWTYFEHTVTGITSITISGSGKIDEVRLYPSASQMISYTYRPLVGITSECDVNNKISYYFYDDIGRLKWIKDQDGNIVKTIQYHYQGLSGIQY